MSYLFYEAKNKMVNLLTLKKGDLLKIDAESKQNLVIYHNKFIKLHGISYGIFISYEKYPEKNMIGMLDIIWILKILIGTKIITMFFTDYDVPYLSQAIT